jgi:hypothetical protein
LNELKVWEGQQGEIGMKWRDCWVMENWWLRLLSPLIELRFLSLDYLKNSSPSNTANFPRFARLKIHQTCTNDPSNELSSSFDWKVRKSMQNDAEVEGRLIIWCKKAARI